MSLRYWNSDTQIPVY